jgi:succinate-semialdehyde dehydrogenase/glutarate-semialdehyde dehydrogenase
VEAAAALESFNPATGQLLGTVATTAPGDVQAVVDAVAQVQPFWAQLTLGDRGRYLERAAQVVLDESDEIRDLIVREQGKPCTEAFSMEILPTVEALHWIARAGPEILAEERVSASFRKRSAFVYAPLGVVGVISTWNLPWSVPLRHVALALMAGNGVVLKPSSVTPLTGERIRRVLERAGVPEGLVRVVHGRGTGAALVESSVGKIFFSGSVQAGRGVGEACARRLKPSALELGGKGPMIVLPDADVERAVSGALWGGFANAGQTCSGIERVYVLPTVAERFIAGVADRAQRLRVGDPLSWQTEVGPLISGERFAALRALVNDAVAAGAALRCGGPAPAGAPFYSPAVLTGVTDEMRIMREQVFGPVLPVVVVDSEDDAIALANGSPFALGASVWTADPGKGERVAAELRAGTMWINDHGGAGRGPTKFGLYEGVEVKLRVSEPSTVRNAWWHPYDETLGQALRQGAMILYGRPSIRARALKEGLGPLLKVSARLARDAVRR